MRISPRRLAILAAVTERYIQTGEPVGSHFVADTFAAPISSATIRNEMAALEHLGLLEQPHASAGRVPTHLGYRVYCDQLMDPKPLTRGEKSRIDALFNVYNPDPDQLLADAAVALAAYTGMTALSSIRATRSATVRRIELVPAGSRTVVILLMTSSGMIKHKVCRVDFGITPEIVDFFVKFSNGSLAGRSIDEISHSYINAVCVSLGEYADVFTPLMGAIYQLVRETGEMHFYAGGQSNLLGYAAQSGHAYDLMRLLDDRQQVLKLLEASGSQDSWVTIGRENSRAELAESSVMVTRYRIGGEVAGSIGVIGPMRMDYARLLSHMEYFADRLGRLLTDTLRGR